MYFRTQLLNGIRRKHIFGTVIKHGIPVQVGVALQTLTFTRTHEMAQKIADMTISQLNRLPDHVVPIGTTRIITRYVHTSFFLLR